MNQLPTVKWLFIPLLLLIVFLFSSLPTLIQISISTINETIPNSNSIPISQKSKVDSIHKSLHILTNVCLTSKGAFIFNNDSNTKHKPLPVHIDINARFEQMNIFSYPKLFENNLKSDVIPFLTYVTQFNNIYHYSFSLFCSYIGLHLASKMDKNIDLNKIQLIYFGHYYQRGHSPLLHLMHGIMSDFNKYPYLYKDELPLTIHSNSTKNWCYKKVIFGRLSHWNLSIDNITEVNNALFKYFILEKQPNFMNILSTESLKYVENMNENTINILLMQRRYPRRYISDINILQNAFQDICDLFVKEQKNTVNKKRIIKYLQMRVQWHKYYSFYGSFHSTKFADLKTEQAKNIELYDEIKPVTNISTNEINCNIIIQEFENLSIVEQFLLAYMSDVLIGSHGAGLAWNLFMPPSSMLIELIPQNSNHGCFPCQERYAIGSQRTWTMFSEIAQLRGANHFCFRVNKTHDEYKKINWKNSPFFIDFKTDAYDIAQQAFNEMGTEINHWNMSFCPSEDKTCQPYLVLSNVETLCNKSPSNFF